MTAATKPIRDVVPGDRTPSGWTYISEPSEQPDGSWAVQMRPPSGARQLVDFADGDADSDVPAVPRIAVSEIRSGDRFVADGKLVWTAVDDATLIDAEEPSDYGPLWARVRVQFADGGVDYRQWDDPSIELPIVRGES